jgi:hypothetical protein
MGSIQGFRCRSCRTEILASPALADLRGHKAWTPPVFCCGRSLVPVEVDQILPTMLALRRFAWCPPCGQRLRLIVQPSGTLICMVCHARLVVVVERDVRSPSPSDQPILGGVR